MVVLTSFSPPSEGIKHEQPSTKLYISGREIGCGTLYIAESKLSWRNSATGEGFSLLYPRIAIHAVSRDVAQFGNECLFIMVDKCLDDMEVNGEEEADDDESGGAMTEMRFVPDDKGQLDAMYQAMTYCQSQHPDPQDMFSEDDEYVDAAEGGHSGAAGHIETHDRSTNGFRDHHSGDDDMETDGQFEDAEDD